MEPICGSTRSVWRRHSCLRAPGEDRQECLSHTLARQRKSVAAHRRSFRITPEAEDLRARMEKSR